jgi:hypothetical protein
LNNFGLLNIIMLILFGFICLVSFTWIFKPESVYEIYGFILILISTLPIVLFVLSVF